MSSCLTQLRRLKSGGTLLNRSTALKLVATAIPPLYEKNNYILDAKDKAELFNDFFVSQTYLPTEGEVLPNPSASQISLSSIVVSEEEVLT